MSNNSTLSATSSRTRSLTQLVSRFAGVGWANMDNERPINFRYTTFPPSSVQISRGEQSRKAPRETAAAVLPRRHTRRMTAEAARKAVFNTSELLENIISSLPPRDILTKVLRLSHQWKTAVETSPTIRNKLWMTSRKAPAFHSIGFADEHIPGVPAWGQGARPMYSCALTLNAALFNQLFQSEGLHALHLGLRDQSLCLQKVDKNGGAWAFPTILFDCRINDSLQQIGAACAPTWRSMYLTSPPITTGMLELHPGPSACHGPYDIYLHLTNRNGITLGLLYDTIFASFETQLAVTLAFSDVKHFYASFHFAPTDASLSTSIMVLE